MNSDQVMDSELPPMEDVPTLKPEDFLPKAGDDEGSKASSAASSDEFVKVTGKDTEEDPLRRMEDVAPETTASDPESFHSEPEDIPLTKMEHEESGQSSLSFVDPRVIDLVHWRDVKQSATVLCFLLLVLGSLTSYSIISVWSYTGLTLLTVTMAFRLYRLALQTINGTQQPHPFQHLLDYDLNINEDQVHKYADSVFKYTNSFLQSARSLLLVENVINSLKLAVCLWMITFIGCCFNGLTLIITGVLVAFSVPPVYEKYQVPIDQNIALVNEKVGAVWSKVQAKIPALKSKTE